MARNEMQVKHLIEKHGAGGDRNQTVTYDGKERTSLPDALNLCILKLGGEQSFTGQLSGGKFTGELMTGKPRMRRLV